VNLELDLELAMPKALSFSSTGWAWDLLTTPMPLVPTIRCRGCNFFQVSQMVGFMLKTSIEYLHKLDLGNVAFISPLIPFSMFNIQIEYPHI
jgi:hypothetical protein